MKQDKSCVIILMTALYKYGPKKFPSKSKYPRLFIIPYSGHCNHDELKEFVRTIKPHTVLPIVLHRTDQPCSVIPKSIFDSCGKVDKPSSCVNEKECEKRIEKSNPFVLVPRLQVSPLRLKRINGSFCPTSAITPVERRSPRSSVVTHACECVSDKASSKDRSEVSTETVNTSLSLRPNTRLSSTSALAVEKERSLKKSTNNTHSLLQLPSSSNATLLPANVIATENERSPKKNINVSIIRSINRSFKYGHPPASSSPNSHARLSAANVSVTEEKRNTRKSTSKEYPPQSVEVHANVVETVQSLSPNAACPSERHPTANENEQPVVYSLNNFVVGGEPNLNEVVTPLRETESEEPLSKNEMGAENIPVFYFPNEMVVGGVPDLSEAVTPPLQEIEREKSRRKNKIDAANMAELEDPNRTTASSPDSCFIREESRNVLLDSVSPHVAQNEENVTDEIPLTLQLRNEDIHSIRKVCRDMLLGPTFPRIYQREEHVEEIPSAASLGSEVAFCENDYMIEDYVIEESIPSTGNICPGREANLLSSKHSNEEAVEADSADSNMEVVDTREPASMCKVVSDTPGIESTTASELPRFSNNSENSLPLRTFERILNTTNSSESSYNRLFSSMEKDVISVSVTVNANHQSSISDFQPVGAKRNRSEDDVTLFELDERVSGRANVTDPASKNTTTVEGGSTSESNEDDSCVLVESSHPINNSSHSLARASPDERLRGTVDADQSDSDDCLVVCEYMQGMETPVYVPFDRASKRMRLDRMYRSRKNDRFVNAIFFHYMKSCPDEMSNLAFDHWNFLSKCNIFSHSAYKRA